MKVFPIEPRLLIAYSLMALLAAGVVAVVFYLRHNRSDQRNARDRARDKARRDARRDG